jgi:8-oxo-dGTP diphosphatase
LKFRNKIIRVRAAALIVEDKSVLLVAHKKGRHTYWLLPGGGVNFNESLSDALKRELKEELGIDIDISGLAYICDSIDPESRRHIINIVFHCSRSGGDITLGQDKRLYGHGFFSDDRLKNMIIFPPVKDELIKIINGESVNDIYLGKLWMNL